MEDRDDYRHLEEARAAQRLADRMEQLMAQMAAIKGGVVSQMTAPEYHRYLQLGDELDRLTESV